MLEVTSAAAEAISGILDESDASVDDCLRLEEREGGRLEFTVSQEQQGDLVINDGDRTVLVVDERVSNALDGATLDYGTPAEGAAGPQFILSRE